MHNILVIDDEPSIRESFSLILKDLYGVSTAATGEVALKMVTEGKIDLAFLDIRMPGMDGIETLRRIKSIDPKVEIIMVTAVNDVRKASEAINLGARDYLIKPFDVDAVLKICAQIFQRKSLIEESAALQQESGNRGSRLIGQSDKIANLNKKIASLAPQNNRILILGENGTEKELVARILHEQSPLSGKPLMICDLSIDMSPASIRATIFGFAKGSTSADLEKKSGLIEACRGGTLIINNFEYLPKELLEDLTSSGARVLGESNLLDFSEKYRETADFFDGGAIIVPSLRERLVDIPLILEAFIGELCFKYGKQPIKFSHQAEDFFTGYSWPGNIRQFGAAVERIFFSADREQVEINDLPLDLLVKSMEPLGSDYLEVFEKDFIRKVYEKSGENIENAASILGISPSLLKEKV